MEFRNILELYERVLPALKTRTRELKREGIIIAPKEIWEDLIIEFKKKKNLSLDEVVNDILNYRP